MMPTDDDLNWPVRFREKEKNYAQFYTRPTESVSILKLYADGNGDLESVRRTRYQLAVAGTLSGEELSKMVAQGVCVGGARYRVAAGGIFTVAIGPESMEPFVATDWEPDAWVPVDVSAAPSISFPETVHALGRETTLVLVLRRRPAAKKRQTARRITVVPPAAHARTTRRLRKGLKGLALSTEHD